MPNYLVEYRVVIRNKADTANLLELTSVRGGTNPYLKGPPRGDGASVDPMTGESMAASYTGQIVDAVTSGTSRVITSQLEDVNQRLQLGYLKTTVYWRRDGGTWLVLCAGYLTLLRLVDSVTWEYTVQDATRVHGGVELFNATSSTTISSFLSSWPNRGCIFGGPIKGSWLSLRDMGGWQFSVFKILRGGEDTGATSSIAGDILVLKPVSWYGPPTWQPNRNWREIADAVNAKVGSLPQGQWNGATVALSTIADAYQNGLQWPGLIYLVNDVPFRPHPTVIDGNGAQINMGLLAHGDTSWGWDAAFVRCDGQAAITRDSLVRVRCLTVLPTEESPIYLDDHPIDHLTAMLSIAGLSYVSADMTAMKETLGGGTRIAQRITGSRQMGQQIQATVLKPFGVGLRVDPATGSLSAFSTRIFTTSAPTDTVTDAMVTEDDHHLPFETDVSEGLQRVTLRQEAFAFYDRQSLDAVHSYDVETTLLNADAGALTSGTLDIDVPGMIRVSPDAREPVGEQWLRGTAIQLFDRFGRGCQALERDLIRGDGTSIVDLLQLGVERLVNIKELPNHNKRLGDDPTVGSRAMQVVRITEKPAVRSVRFMDSGPNAQLGTTPNYGVSQSADSPGNVAEVTIANAAALNALGYAVRIQMAVTTGAAPAAADYADAVMTNEGAIPTGLIRLPSIRNGRTVYVRCRSEKVGARPSNWGGPVFVAMATLTAPSAMVLSNVAGDASRCNVRWAVGVSSLPVEVLLRRSGQPFSAAAVVDLLPAGSIEYELQGLTPSTAYIVSVRHVSLTSNDYSAELDGSFTSGAVSAALNAPVEPRGFTAAIAGVFAMYGMAVVAQEFPSETEFEEAVETAVGSGVYGSFRRVARVTSVWGDDEWTFFKRIAASDRKRRQLRARHVRNGDGSSPSSYTSTVTVTPFSQTPLPARSAPSVDLDLSLAGLVSARIDGPLTIASYRYLSSSIAQPSEASTESTGTILNGRQQSVSPVLSIGVNETCYVTVIPYNGPNATGVKGAPVNVRITRGEPWAAPQGTVSIDATGAVKFAVDGPLSAESYRWQASTSSYPADATVAAGGTVINGRSHNDVSAGITLSIGQRVYITLVPFTSGSATGYQGQSIHLTATRHDASATKTVRYSAMSLMPMDAFSAAHFVATSGYVAPNGTADGDDLFFRMLVPLPDGVTVTNVTAYQQNSASNGPRFSFVRIDTSGASNPIIANAGAGGTGWVSNSNGISESTSSRRYALEVWFDIVAAAEEASTAISAWDITYTMPSTVNSI